MLLRPFLNDAGSCASDLIGCTSKNELAVVDPHADFVCCYSLKTPCQAATQHRTSAERQQELD